MSSIYRVVIRLVALAGAMKAADIVFGRATPRVVLGTCAYSLSAINAVDGINALVHAGVAGIATPPPSSTDASCRPQTPDAG